MDDLRGKSSMRQDEERGSTLPFDIVKAMLKLGTGSDVCEVPVPNLANQLQFHTAF